MIGVRLILLKYAVASLFGELIVDLLDANHGSRHELTAQLICDWFVKGAHFGVGMIFIRQKQHRQERGFFIIRISAHITKSGPG